VSTQLDWTDSYMTSWEEKSAGMTLDEYQPRTTTDAILAWLGVVDPSQVVQASGIEGDGPEEVDNLLVPEDAKDLGESGDGSAVGFILAGVRVVMVSEPGYRGILVDRNHSRLLTLELLQAHQDPAYLDGGE
jgi:hypothetical protein